MTDDEIVDAILKASPAKLRQVADAMQDGAFRLLAKGESDKAARGEQLAAALRQMADDKEQRG